MNTPRAHSNEAPVSVSLHLGQASGAFRRHGSRATLDMKYRVRELQTQLPDGDLQRGVERLCEQEVTAMRASLSQLGSGLADQLSDEGKDTTMHRTGDTHDSRTWSDGGSSFSVDGSMYSSNDEMTLAEGVADSKAVQATVRAAIRQREGDIRKLYNQILIDALVQRAKGAGAKSAQEEKQPTHARPQASEKEGHPLLQETELPPSIDRLLDPHERIALNCLRKIKGQSLSMYDLRETFEEADPEFKKLSYEDQCWTAWRKARMLEKLSAQDECPFEVSFYSPGGGDVALAWWRARLTEKPGRAARAA